MMRRICTHLVVGFGRDGLRSLGFVRLSGTFMILPHYLHRELGKGVSLESLIYLRVTYN